MNDITHEQIVKSISMIMLIISEALENGSIKVDDPDVTAVINRLADEIAGG